MSEDKDGKAQSPVRAPAAKTVVGVPALPVPEDRPSDLEMTRQLAPKDDDDDQRPTAMDVKALSPAEAEAVLARGTPAPHAPAPRPAAGAAARSAVPRATASTSPDGSAGAKRSANAKSAASPVSPRTSASRSVPPPVPKGHATHRGGGPIPPTRDAIEEISSSMLLPDATGEALASAAEELSGSVLIEDPPDGKGPPVVTRPSGGMQASPRAPSVKPPVPKSTASANPAPAPAAHRSLLGMPELPKATPAPKLDFMGSAPPSPGSSARLPAASANAHPPPAAANAQPPAAPANAPSIAGPASAAPHGPSPTPPPAQSPVPATYGPLPEPGDIPTLARAPAYVPPSAPKLTPAPAAGHGAARGPFGLSASVAPPAQPLPPDGVPPPDPEIAAVVWPPPGETPFGSVPPKAAASPSAPPAPTTPMTGDIELTRLPRSGLAPVLDALRAAWKRSVAFARELGPKLEPLLKKLGPAWKKLREKVPALAALDGNTSRPKWVLPAVTAGGALVGIGLVALVISVARGCGGGDKAKEATASGAAGSALPLASGAAAATPGTAAPAPPAAACTVAGAPHVIAPNATVAAGVEVVRAGDALAVGFASGEHDAMAVVLDPSSLSATSTVKARSRDAVRRVTPLPGKNGVTVAVDADRKNDKLQGRRVVMADPPLQLGATGGHVSWAHVSGKPEGDLWSIDDGAPVDALRGAADVAGGDNAPVAVAFRRAGSVWMGTASSGQAPATMGDLAHVDGLGTTVGSPAVALGGGVALVAWSDRSASEDPWHVRWVRFAAGSAPGAPQTFAPPAGGRGEQAMSPSLTALSGGRFLLVWTEGPMSAHDVRALTLDANGAAVGGALIISTPGVNAGQGQAAVLPSGQGVVAFLESNGGGFEVVATGVTCP